MGLKIDGGCGLDGQSPFPPSRMSASESTTSPQPSSLYWTEVQCPPHEQYGRKFRLFALFPTGKCCDFGFVYMKKQGAPLFPVLMMETVELKQKKLVMDYRRVSTGAYSHGKAMWTHTEIQNRAKNWVEIDELSEKGYPDVHEEVKRLVSSGTLVWPYKRLGYSHP